DGALVFDINDFDETVRAPFEWDLKRMAASLVLAGREAGHKDRSSREAVLTCVVHYATLMRTFAQMPLIEVSRFQVHRIGSSQPVHNALLKAERMTPLRTLEQRTEPVGDEPAAPRRFPQDPPQLSRLSDRVADDMLSGLVAYRAILERQRRHLLSLCRVVDVAFKV